MNQCYEYRIWILSYHLFDPKCTKPRGFVCSDTYEGHLPSEYKGKLQYWFTHIFIGVKKEGILPPPGQQILTQVNGDGYLVLKELAQLFQPYLMKNPTSIIPSHPIQCGLYSTYHLEIMFFYELQGWIFNNVYDFGDKNDQNTFIAHLHYSDEVWKLKKRINHPLNLVEIEKMR